MTGLSGAVGRNIWIITGAAGVATLAAGWLGDYQLMALLACLFGGLLMWDAEQAG